jgi:hypothetical protein
MKIISYHNSFVDVSFNGSVLIIDYFNFYEQIIMYFEDRLTTLLSNL